MERNNDLKAVSQMLRKTATKEENILWYNFLRRYPVQFRRQYVVGSYIVDFFCYKAKLVVELDGSQHYEQKKAECDQKRTEYLKSQGLLVLRFSNLDVLRQFKQVCNVIDETVKMRALPFLPNANK